MLREEMLDRMTPDEFLGWMAYSEIEPFGEDRQDIRAALDWQLLATVNSDSKKNPNGIGLDRYPLFEMAKRLIEPQVAPKPAMTSKGFLGVMKALSEGKKPKSKRIVGGAIGKPN